MKYRSEFSARIKETLAKRVGFKCSNPNCTKSTSGPATEKDKSVSIGVAAHIFAASNNGPRSDNKISETERKSIENGIWLCYSCSVLIEDVSKFTVNLLKSWKDTAEKKAENELDSSLNDEYYYNGVYYSRKLHAIWASFFDQLSWHHRYEIKKDSLFKYDFILNTSSGEEYKVYVMLKSEFTLDFRLKLGVATKFSKNILILFENPFPISEYGYLNNIIGMSSVEGKTKNTNGEDDFEFCTAVVSSKTYSIGTNIYNLCMEDMLHDVFFKEESFCLEKWKKSMLIIGK